jgi:putative ABC transport system substrate-binding protein
MMRRRTFIAGLGSAAVWPVLARTQQRTPVIGYLALRTPESDAAFLAAFRRGLSQTGYVEGTNVAIEFRWAEGRFDRLAELAESLARQQVALFVTTGGVAVARAARTASPATPIVFTSGGDPVESGLVDGLARPGRNMTGISTFTGTLASKQLALLRELVPTARLIAMLVNPDNPPWERQVSDAEAAARAVGVQIAILKATTSSDIELAFETVVRQRVDALLFGANPFFYVRVKQLVDLATRHKVPTMFWQRDLAKAGGLVSYGANIDELLRQIGIYAGRILNGERPANLPVVQPTKFELVLNLKTAKALGLTIPQTLLATADEVVQ